MTHLEELLKEKSHILWDWNGTLLNDVDLCVSTMSEVLTRYGLPSIDRETYRKTFSFPVNEYYQTLGFDFEKYPFSKVADEWMQIYQSNIKKAELHDGAEEILMMLRKTRKTQSILSAAKQTHLEEQLDSYQIRHHFDHVYGIADHYAKGKIERGLELLRLLNDDPETMILIGDTDHDKDVADALGIELLLLADGHQHIDRLKHLDARVITDRAANKKPLDQKRHASNR